MDRVANLRILINRHKALLIVIETIWSAVTIQDMYIPVD